MTSTEVAAHNIPDVEVRRSTKRRKTVSGAWRDGRIIVSIPAWFSAKDEEKWVADMVAKLQAPRSRTPRRTDADLRERAASLSATYLQGLARPTSIAWVGNQNTRWGSCTPATGAIRISQRLRDMPAYVVDYVILHELTHLLAPGHGPDFWAWLATYPHTERAKAFLAGAAFAMHRGLEDDSVD